MVGAGDVGLDARRWPPKTAARGPLKLGLAITDAHSGPFWPADGLDLPARPLAGPSGRGSAGPGPRCRWGGGPNWPKQKPLVDQLKAFSDMLYEWQYADRGASAGWSTRRPCIATVGAPSVGKRSKRGG